MLPGGSVSTRVALQQPDIDLAVLAVPVDLTATGASPAGTGALVVAVDAEGFNAATSQLLGLLVAGLGAVVLAMTALSWVLTGRALGSVTRIAEDAEAIRTHGLATGLPVPHGDTELERLVEALNRMLTRLHHSHAAELAFAADAGHRLRTPVATLRAEAELALRETDPVELTAALERVVQDADQLTSIVDRMLARSRALGREPRPVRAVLVEASPRWQRQAQLNGATLTVQVDGALTDDDQCVEVVEIIEPLVDNAVRHTPETGLIAIRARLAGPSGKTVQILVSNTGEPIATDLVPQLFDAWVSSRDASVAGGLGLWVARENARDLGGDVQLLDDTDDTDDATGSATTVFQVTLPLTAPQ